MTHPDPAPQDPQADDRPLPDDLSLPADLSLPELLGPELVGSEPTGPSPVAPEPAAVPEPPSAVAAQLQAEIVQEMAEPAVSTRELSAHYLRQRRRAQLAGWGFAVCAAVLIPWTVYLFLTLPERVAVDNHDLMWGVYDLGLIAVLVATSWSALRAVRWLPMAATSTATFLVIDAWFDLMTSSGSERPVAVAMAVFAELPGAAFALALAVRGQGLVEHHVTLRERIVARASRLGRNRV